MDSNPFFFFLRRPLRLKPGRDYLHLQAASGQVAGKMPGLMLRAAY
jgi:hypothetical protein